MNIMQEVMKQKYQKETIIATRNIIKRAVFPVFVFMFAMNILNAQDRNPHNSIIVQTNFIAMSAITYDRLLPLNHKMALSVGGGYIMGTGFGYGSHWLRIESGLLSFGPRHYLETGIQYIIGINDDSSPGLKLAYRFRCKNGITFYAATNFLFNIDPVFLPSVGVGYSF